MQTQFNFLESLDLDQDVKRRLSIHLQNVVEGNGDIYRTPLAKNLDAQTILEKWDTVFHSQSTKIIKQLEDLEESNRSKFGPRSIAVPWEERREGVAAYFGASNDKDYSSLFSSNPTIRKTLKAGALRPLSNKVAVSYLKNSTNAGLPFYVRKGIVKERVLENFNEYLKRKDPCIMFTRTQESKKTRTVWGFPIADTLNEMRYYRPLLDYQKKQPWRAAIVSPDATDSFVTKLINTAVSNKEMLVSIDFSAYDTTIKGNLQKEAFSYIKYLYQNQHAGEIDYIADRFGNIGLLTPDGVILGHHGVPSGSTFTNEVDSIAQYLVSQNSGIYVNPFSQIQGDDGAYGVKEPEKLIEAFKYHGLQVNEEKSYIAEDYLIYLQNLYSKQYERNGIIGGIYPTYRALNRLIFQERWDNFEEYGLTGSDYYSIRAISILENCRNHPYFEEFVKFVASLDKYSLRPSQEGINKYVKMLNDKRGTEGIIENQYGDSIKGIRNFEVFKLLSKL